MGGHKHPSQLPGCLVAAQFLSGLLMVTCHFDRANEAIAKRAREKPPDQKVGTHLKHLHIINTNTSLKRLLLIDNP
ncbi:MAG: hypothetical protein IH594_14000 [Bacteroidales bacterium]|nr:hypothetical protein [Bacteroidales bacterium]